MKSTMMHYPLTIAHLLERANRYFPGVEVVSLLPDKSLHRTGLGRLTARARALCQALLRAGLKPDDYVFIDAIPRSSTGKFSKLTLRERYQGYFTSRARG